MSERLFSPLEYAPGWVVYLLHGPYWVWLSLCYGGITTPVLANPGLYLGGFLTETKSDQYELLGPTGKARLAPYAVVSARADSVEVARAMAAASLAFPIVAKPDMGRNGRGVKIVSSEDELARHLAAFPPEVHIILQRYIADPLEAGIFYIRRPNETHGRISSLTLKYFPEVVGDGVRSVRELVLADPRASRIAHIYLRRNHASLDTIPAKGERHRLVSVGNHVRGALFEDGGHDITPELLDAVEAIVREMRGIYFVRFDTRSKDLDALKRGEFTILEYNGVSSEPTHVWDRRTGIIKTYRDLLGHWRTAFQIGAENRRRGAHSAASGLRLLELHNAECALLARYPDEE